MRLSYPMAYLASATNTSIPAGNSIPVTVLVTRWHCSNKHAMNVSVHSQVEITMPDKLSAISSNYFVDMVKT